jgi:hypothetical protein
MGFWDDICWHWNFTWNRDLMSYDLKQLDSLIEILNSTHLHKYKEEKCWILDSLLILGFKPFLADI